MQTDSKTDMVSLFKNSIYLAWIDHIENKYPELRSVSTLKFDKMIGELQDAVHQKMESSSQILLQRVRENSLSRIRIQQAQ